MTEPRIHMRHARALRGRGKQTCTPGLRGWAALHNIDLMRFAREGYAGEDALRIGDYFALELLDIARTEAAGNGR
ncbi:hypothetical protein [Thermomonas sp.]|uniref:hypothetical protein n=1 Tax=Thermomonas sp. TaxID=1971895 RepID=UPI0035B00841